MPSIEELATGLEKAAAEQLDIVNWKLEPLGPQTAILFSMRSGGPSFEQKERAGLKAEIYSDLAAILRRA